MEAMAEDGASELDVSGVAELSELAREFRRYHFRGDTALASIPRWYALCTHEPSEDAIGTLREASAAAVRASATARLTAFIANGWAHPSQCAAAPEKLTSAIEEVAACVRGMQSVVTRANTALGDLIEAASGHRMSDASDGAPATEVTTAAVDTHWIDDVPVPIMRTAFAWGSSEPLLVEQWLWICTSIVEQLEREYETRKKILDYLRRGEMNDEELSGCATVWSTQPFLDLQLFNLVCADGEKLVE